MEEGFRALGFTHTSECMPFSTAYYRIDGKIIYFAGIGRNDMGWCMYAMRQNYPFIPGFWAQNDALDAFTTNDILEVQCFIMKIREKHPELAGATP